METSPHAKTFKSHSWCDSMQYDDTRALHKYAQYYHFVKGLTQPQFFQPTRHYTSPLEIRTCCLWLHHQENGTDCGIFSLIYQQALSKWYGEAAGHIFNGVDQETQHGTSSGRTTQGYGPSYMATLHNAHILRKRIIYRSL